MNTREMSIEFDLMYNNLSSNSAPGLDEYEKSVLLTSAQEMVVNAVIKGDDVDSLDGTEEGRARISSLFSVAEGTPASGAGVSKASVFYRIPKGILHISSERVVSGGCQSSVLPVSQDQLMRKISNPFNGPKRNPIRVARGEDLVEVIYSGTIDSYVIDYVRKPRPIILSDITEEGLSIDGETKESACELNESLHRPIVLQAVSLAKAAWK